VKDSYEDIIIEDNNLGGPGNFPNDKPVWMRKESIYEVPISEGGVMLFYTHQNRQINEDE